MKRQNLLLLTGLVFSLSSYAEYKIDKTEEIGEISLQSGKEKKIRLFTGTASRTLPYSIAMVRKGITNFTDKCNNSLKNKRKFTPSTYDCKYHNEHVVESFVETDLKQRPKTEFFLIGKKLYHLNSSSYYELIEVKESSNDKNQKMISITQRMLDNDEAKAYVTPKLKNNSDFKNKLVSYTLTETSPKETIITYKYEAKTDHWMMNKQVNVPQIFISISKSINEAFRTIEKESGEQTREVASK